MWTIAAQFFLLHSLTTVQCRCSVLFLGNIFRCRRISVSYLVLKKNVHSTRPNINCILHCYLVASYAISQVVHLIIMYSILNLCSVDIIYCFPIGFVLS